MKLACHRLLFVLLALSISAQASADSERQEIHNVNVSGAKMYQSEESFDIKLENVSFGQRIVILFRNMERGLRKLFKFD